MAGLRIAVAGRHGMEASLYVEREEFLLVEPLGRFPESPLIQVLGT